MRARALRLVLENEANYKSRLQAIASIAQKIGCSKDRLRCWVKKQDGPAAGSDALTTSERDELKALKREVKELKQANEILLKASAFFAALSGHFLREYPAGQWFRAARRKQRMRDHPEFCALAW